MTDDSKGPTAEAVAFAAMARDDLARTQSYLERGRQFGDLDDEALSGRWVQDMRAWARSIRDKPTTLDDAEAEFKLRRQAAPYHLVASEAEEIIAAAGKIQEAMTKEVRDRANAEMAGEYEVDQRRRN